MNGKNAPHSERPIPADARDAWAEELSLQDKQSDEILKLRYFVFRTGAEWYGLPPSVLYRVLPYAKPALLPHRVDTVIEGLVNADGRVITCFSMERLLGGTKSSNADNSRHLIILNWQQWTIAMRADDILGIEDLDARALQGLPQSTSQGIRTAARGLILANNRAILCLDGDAFFQKIMEAAR